MKLCPLILAGGGGTRLWPLSREHYPKQFLKLFDDRTLLQNTMLRLKGLDALSPIVICNEEHRFLVAEQGAQINENMSKIILEPEGRNTAPALTIAALHLVKENDDAVIIMMPADHLIKNTEAFHQAIQAGEFVANQDRLVTFGIKPDKPETGYGYIHSGEMLNTIKGQDVNEILGFKEKPEQPLAEKYLQNGHYFWNSGIFMMRASIWLDHIQKLQPDIHSNCQAALNESQVDGLFTRLGKDSFLSSPNDSIDYAVMEKLAENFREKLAVLPIDVGWSDVGSWSSVWEKSEKDKDNNYIEGDVITQETTNCFIKSNRGLIVTVGCDDLVLVETDDATMVAKKDQTQDVKKIVAKLNDLNRKESLEHRKVYRPWGSYDSIDIGDNFQVKRLTVNPGKKLSLQLHHKRAEHWVVVKGTATVTRGEEVFQLNENESTFIPVETKHRLENATDNMLELIEVQSGPYLGEDDIVRFDDDFGRD